jgi:hypothetical protein
LRQLFTTASVSLIYAVNNVLQVQTAGQGKLSTNDNNAALVIGKRYRLTVTGTNGFVFTHWTIAANWLGGCVTNNATDAAGNNSTTNRVRFQYVVKNILGV